AAAGRVLISCPGNIAVLIARLEALWRAGRDVEAERACRQILARHPRILKPRVILGQLLAADLDRRAEGLATIRAAFADDAGRSVAAKVLRGRDEWPSDLGSELILDVPGRLLSAPPEIEAAL